MKWSAVLKDFNGDRGVICLENSKENITIPIDYLPDDCRIGDVFQFTISFDPFNTLALLKGRESGSLDY